MHSDARRSRYIPSRLQHSSLATQPFSIKASCEMDVAWPCRRLLNVLPVRGRFRGSQGLRLCVHLRLIVLISSLVVTSPSSGRHLAVIHSITGRTPWRTRASQRPFSASEPGRREVHCLRYCDGADRWRFIASRVELWGMLGQ